MSLVFTSLTALFAVVTVLTTAEQTIYLTKANCGKVYVLPFDYSSTTVKTKTSNVLGDDCNVTFYTEDYAANINLKFGDDDGDICYIDDRRVSISLYSNHQLGGPKLIRTYTLDNDSKLQSQPAEVFVTNSLSIVMKGSNSDYWKFFFQINAIDGPVSGYPISIAAGVFALCIASVTVVTLLLVCCYCCCCRTAERQQISVHRRTRIINQLRKEGYSVTRDYGAISDTTPILRDGSASVDPPRSPREYVRYPRGASNYDPPPSYDIVRGMSTPKLPQPSAPEATLPRLNQPLNSTDPRPDSLDRRAYDVSYYSNPQPTALIVIGEREPSVPHPPSLEANLIDFETDVSEVQQTDNQATDVLIRFDTPPEQGAVYVDLLCNDAVSADAVTSIPPPAFGEVR